MELNETSVRLKRLAIINKSKAERNRESGNDDKTYQNECLERAEKCYQLSKWLKELIKFKENKCENCNYWKNTNLQHSNECVVHNWCSNKDDYCSFFVEKKRGGD